jgi:HlyD family secretion protein
LKSLANRLKASPPAWLALTGLACLLLAGCQAAPITQAATFTQAEVQVALAAQPEPDGFEVKGKLVPRQHTTLALSEGVRAIQVLVEEGQQVKAGDVLIRLDGYEQVTASLAATELELVLARQAVDDLNREAELKLAETELSLAEAIYEQALAQDLFESISRPTPGSQIDQAYANLLLAEHQLTDARNDLEKAQRIFANKKHIIWRFINKHDFKLRITLLEQQVATQERRYQDASEKYSDLVAGKDPIDLALAETRLATANANLQRLQSERQELSNGPDPDALQAAEARLQAALAQLDADRIALSNTELLAPMDGTVIDLTARQGQWVPAGAPIAVLADLDEWVVETEDLDELLVAGISAGQPVRVQLDAIPELSLLDGQVETIDLLYTEDDEEIFYTVQVRLTEDDPRLRWGMTARLESTPAGQTE